MLLNFHPKNQKSINEKKMLGIVVVYVSISALEMLYCRKCIKGFKERSDSLILSNSSSSLGTREN